MAKSTSFVPFSDTFVSKGISIWMKMRQNAVFIVWDQRVAGSNPATPTFENQGDRLCLTPFTIPCVHEMDKHFYSV
jgi:hypothetical protein